MNSASRPWPPGTLLHRLPEQTAADLLALGVLMSWRPGSILIRQGDPEQVVHLLVDGLVKVVATVENGVESLLGVRIGGDIVGEMAVLGDAPRLATVISCGEVVSAAIPGKSFMDFAATHAVLGITLSQMTGDRLRWANQMRQDAAAYGVDICLARALLALAERHGRRVPDEPNEVDIGVPLTQAELGALIGAREVSVQRALRELEASGLVRRGRRRVIILDHERLAGFATNGGPAAG